MYAYVETWPGMAKKAPDPSSQVEIANRLKLLREALDYTQQTMADLIGTAPQAWGNYETAVRRIRVDEALRLCSAVGVTLDWIYRGNMSQLPLELSEKIQIALRDRQRLIRARN